MVKIRTHGAAVLGTALSLSICWWIVIAPAFR